MGLADDQDSVGIDGVCEPWLNELWTILAPNAVVSKLLLPPKYTIEWLNDEQTITPGLGFFFIYFSFGKWKIMTNAQRKVCENFTLGVSML